MMMIPHPLGEPVGELKEHALAYAELGLEVFPLNANKTPKTTHGWKEATSNLEQIEAWWTRWPAALIGCRVPQDLVLLDVDPRHGGVETWKLIRSLWAPPLTRAHKSGRGDGGGHTWWTRPADKLSVRKLDDWAREHGVGHAVSETRWVSGIDVLHWDHRYTILPPSPHPETGQPYEWVTGRGLDFEALAMPVDLADLLSADEAPDSPPPAPRILDPDSPADWYSHHHSCADTLAGHGWKVVAGDGVQDRSRWRHPTATAAYSATIRFGCLFVYSPNTEFEVTEPGRPHGYTPFATFALLDHRGDQSEAARAARTMRGDQVGEPAWDFVAAAPQKPQEGVEDEEVEPVAPPREWPQLPTEALHGPFGEIVESLEPHTEADPAGILACLLTYFAAATGPGPHFRLSSTTQNARINVLIVGDSARARKGTAESMARWVIRTADAAITSDRRVTGLNSGEGLIEAVRDPKWGRDKNGNEVLVDAGVDDKRLLLYEPEFAGRLLTALKRSGSTISALLRTAWDDGNLQTMNARNPLRATGAHLCVIGNVTIDELLGGVSVDDLAGGLLNRFLFVAVRSGRRLPFGGTLCDGDVEKLGRRLQDRLEAARTRTRVDFDDSCREQWPGAYDALMDDAPPGPLGHLTARGPTQVQRLALIYALADGARTIGIEHLAAGIAFWGYCRDSAELIFTADQAGHVTGDIGGDQLLAALIESGRPWTVMEIRTYFGWSGTREAGVRAKLEKLGLIKTGLVARQGGGRPRTVVIAR